MPAATPILNGPTVLTLYTAADLLTGTGCPVCRYAGESGNRYLAWFALEAHADPATVTRLCSSLGMCPRHTRALMSQPGAARRLTAVYGYLVRSTREQLTGHRGRLAACQACGLDERASGRALEVLVEDLSGDSAVRYRYLELGGLCIPHLRSAPARGNRRIIAWLAQAQAAAASSGPAIPLWLAGTDHDAPARAVLRQAATTIRLLPGMCVACLAAARVEHDRLSWVVHRGGRDRPDPGLALCAGHLSDLIFLAGEGDAVQMLTWQAACLGAGLTQPPARRRFRKPASLARCSLCLSAGEAARQALDNVRAALRPGHAPGRQAPLCVRHLLGLAAADPRAGKLTAPAAVGRADALITELDEAFSKGTWARRHEAAGPEMTAWRRAAAFLDGGVFCGCPPPDRSR